MPPLALGLLLVAAVLHTSWNLLLKRSGADTWLVSWWALLLMGLLSLPLLAAQPLPPQIWPYLLASAIFEMLYFTLLAAAYKSADFSLVYPVARGAAPALIALWAVLLLGERPSPGGLLGLAVIVGGLVVVAWRPSSAGRASYGGVGLALGVALCISAYSTIDAAAVRQVPALTYTMAVLGLSALLSAPAALWRYGLRGLPAAGWASRRLVGGVSLLMPGAYLLAMIAYSIAPVSYAGAVREVSVILGALAGWLLFGEPLGARRLGGAAVISLGIALIAALG